MTFDANKEFSHGGVNRFLLLASPNSTYLGDSLHFPEYLIKKLEKNYSYVLVAGESNNHSIVSENM